LQADAYRKGVCQPNQPCPTCPSFPNLNLIAVCKSSKCEAIDLTMDGTFSKCNEDKDCTLRVGSECCEICGQADPSQVIALAADSLGDFRKTVCKAETSCPKCAAFPPKGLKAVCKGNGGGRRCEVQGQ
jgi:hypothetical protein